jgi:hypothetical protein
MRTKGIFFFFSNMPPHDKTENTYFQLPTLRPILILPKLPKELRNVDPLIRLRLTFDYQTRLIPIAIYKILRVPLDLEPLQNPFDEEREAEAPERRKGGG